MTAICPSATLSCRKLIAIRLAGPQGRERWEGKIIGSAVNLSGPEQELTAQLFHVSIN
jgi:hypothetical protein